MARFGAIAVVLFAVAIFAWLKWSETEAGIVAGLNSKLKGAGSRSAALEGLDLAERFKSIGQKSTAEKIEAAVLESFRKKELKGADAVKDSVEFSNELLKRGDKYFAGRFALYALRLINEEALKNKNFDFSRELLAEADSAAQNISTSKMPLSEEERLLIIKTASKFAGTIEKNGSAALLVLAIESVVNTPVSSEGISVMYSRNLLAAKQEQISDLDADIKQTAQALDQVGRKASLEDDPAGCFAAHLISVALILESNHAAMASKYLSLAEDLLRQNDTSRLSESERKVFARCMRRLSFAYLAIGDKAEAIACARASVDLRPLQDAESAECSIQLLNALADSGKYSEAEPIAASSYKYLKTASGKDDELKSLRSNCASAYFAILSGLGKNTSAQSIINEEIKEQKKLLPASALKLVELNSKLADYYLKRRELKNAASAAQKISLLVKHLKDEQRLDADMLLIQYGAKTRTAQLALDASMDALAFLDKQGGQVKQSWLDGLCIALESLKKLEAQQTYEQVLAQLKNGFLQQLPLPDADPLALAGIVNTLGISGEEKLADSLRGQAVEKLAENKKAVFTANSMDFVVSGEQDTAQYTDPADAVKVYLDLAASMKGKDDEQAFKCSYEAMKIAQLLAMKTPEKKEQLFESVDAAAGIMLKCKKFADKNQLSVLSRLAGLFGQQASESGKIQIIDLLLASESKNHMEPQAESFAFIMSKGEILARRGQTALLDAHINQYRNQFATMMGSPSKTCAYYIKLADLLSLGKEPGGARRYYRQAKTMLERMEQNAREADRLAKTEDKNVRTGSNAAVSAAQGPNAERLSTATALKYWAALASGLSRAGDPELALACARRAVALKPMNDPQGVSLAIQLVDRLIATGNHSEAESQAIQIYDYCKSQNQTETFSELRSSIVSRLLAIDKALHKDDDAIALLKTELADRQVSSARPVQSAQLYAGLVQDSLLKGDASAAADSLREVGSLRRTLAESERSRWIASGLPKDLLWYSLTLNYPKLAGQSLSDLMADKNLNRAEALRQPEKWWSSGLVYFRRAGDLASYRDLLDFVKDGYRQELASNKADLTLLVSVLTELAPLRESRTVLALRDQAISKLNEEEKTNFKNQLGKIAELEDAAAPESEEAKAAEQGDESAEAQSAGQSSKTQKSQDDQAEVQPPRPNLSSGSQDKAPRSLSSNPQASKSKGERSRGRIDLDD